MKKVFILKDKFILPRGVLLLMPEQTAIHRFMVGSLSQISLSEITFVPISFHKIKVELKLPFALVLWHDSGKILGEKIYLPILELKPVILIF